MTTDGDEIVLISSRNLQGEGKCLELDNSSKQINQKVGCSLPECLLRKQRDRPWVINVENETSGARYNTQ